jgi:excisionase family DNA binding protein
VEAADHNRDGRMPAGVRLSDFDGLAIATLAARRSWPVEGCAVVNDLSASNERMLLPIRLAAQQLSICEKTLWSLTKQGKIPAVRIGRAVRYSPADLAAWIERTKTGGPVGA